MNDKIRVMLTTEGTYPFHQGGVSTWCDTLVRKLPDIDYVLYSVIMNPFVQQKFNLPKDSELIKVPLWGTEEPSEHLATPFSQVYISKKKTVDKVVKEHFIPLFSDLLDEIIVHEKNPERFGNALLNLHYYFQEYEYKKSFKSEITWDVFKSKVSDFTKLESSKIERPSVYSLIQSLGWIYRFLNILNTPIPDVHVSHSSAAAFCGIPCVLAKLKNKTPFLLTEHGVYLREQYLSLSQRGYSSFLNTFLMRMIHSVSNINFVYADQVSPVCNYNTRWEREFGVPQEKIKVIYNGVDENIFSPQLSVKKHKYPTVVTVARVDPIKDLITLLKAAALVRERIPDVRFIVYGSVSVPKYYEKCLKLRKEMDMETSFIFAGHTSDTSAAYKSGDIVALSSISEAFPYSVVEAMMERKPVVATDVGGIREALADTGICVEPRNQVELAEGIIKLLSDPALREAMGEDARERALNFFTLKNIMQIYFKSYIDLALSMPIVKSAAVRYKKQGLLMERAYALMYSGFLQKAIDQFRLAISENANTPAVPVILMEIAGLYNQMGNFENASHELEKAKIIAEIIESQQTA